MNGLRSIGGSTLIMSSNSYTVAMETFQGLALWFRQNGKSLEWTSPFILPGWLQAWWQVFTPSSELCILSVKEGERTVGIAPLQVEERTARFIGNRDVCDHLDVIVAAGKKKEFCGFLMSSLKEKGIDRLELGPVRPDSVVMATLLPIVRDKGFPVAVMKEDVLYELALPDSWGGYLRLLSGKQRHEVRRKLRRLEKSGSSEFRMLDGPAALGPGVDDFLALFRQNRKDKAVFMDERMEAFFRALADGLPETKIGFLYVDGAPAAAVWCCDHRSTRYLYNSGYDANLSRLGVGILCKILSIRESIARGLKTYDFLKGDETYKRQLGGSPVSVYRCRIDLAG